MTWQDIIVFLIDTSQWQILQKISTDIKQKLEDNNQYNSDSVIMCELSLGIADIMVAVSAFTETQGYTHLLILCH